ncbi:MAG: alpha/beta fold hydrolase [Bdellovibrionota bacterium]
MSVAVLRRPPLERIYSFGEFHFPVTEESPADSDCPTLLFLHGRLGSGRLWRPLLARLSERKFRCVTLEFPPLAAADLALLVEQLVEELLPAGERVILVGHDTGAGVAQLYALETERRVAAMALLEPICPAQPLPLFEIGYFSWQVRRKLRRAFRRCPRLSAEVREELRSPWGHRLARAGLIRAVHAFEDSWPELYERRIWKQAMFRFDAPVLLLYGRDDFLIPRHQVEELAKWYPHALFYERERVGHWPHLEDPDWVAAKLRETIFQSEGLRSVRRSLWR